MVSCEKRESGVIAAVKEGYGFIRCAERDARVFFHFSEMVTLTDDVDVNTEVEFTIAQDQAQSNKQSAVRIKVLPPGTVQFEVVTQRNMIGTVTREPSSSWAQRSPNRVSVYASHHFLSRPFCWSLLLVICIFCCCTGER